ncbi:MAG TPA: hypothetical protein PL033_08570 [Candidatus Brocadiia bacterium]|nr:hypothetical protein [Candidatus Brocadiia bacterium]
MSFLTQSPLGSIGAIAAGLLLSSCAGIPEKPGSQDQYLVGVYYFAGWWREQPNKWTTGGIDWRAEYPGRVPLLGEYNEQETMDREIIAASDHGVDFFQILWYSETDTGRYEFQDRLNGAVEQFMKSPNNVRMSFTVEFVNHPPFILKTGAQWDAACRQWCGYMKHPRYLRVDGRPVFKIHGAHHFYNQCDQDAAAVASRISRFREIARQEGVGEILISSGVGAEGVATGPIVAPYDFLTIYNWIPPHPPRAEPYPFKDMLDMARNSWAEYARKGDRPFVPYVPSGWDPRPWKDPRPSFVLPDREQWREALTSIQRTLDEFPQLGVPRQDGSRQQMLLIYAWNEFGEGGMVAPTRGEGYMKLEAIKEVFGK